MPTICKFGPRSLSTHTILLKLDLNGVVAKSILDLIYIAIPQLLLTLLFGLKSFLKSLKLSISSVILKSEGHKRVSSEDEEIDHYETVVSF